MALTIVTSLEGGRVLSIGINLIPPLVMLGVSGFVYAIAHFLTTRDDRVQLRLNEAARTGLTAHAPRSDSRGRLVNLIAGMLPESLAHLLIGGTKQRNHLQHRLLRAGLYGTGAVRIFAIAKIALVAIPVLVIAGLIATESVNPKTGLTLGLFAAGIGLVLPGLSLDRMCRRRQLKITRSLPDFLDLLIACVSSGVSLESALLKVTQELGAAHPLLAREMTRVQHEINLGATVDEALHNLAERTSLSSLKSLAALCQQSRQFGVKISDALCVHADMLRTQREQRAEELAQKAAVKILIPTLLLIFPTIFVVLAGPAAIQIWTNLSSPQAQAEVSASRPR